MSPRLTAEALGTGFLLFVIVGSGIVASTLSDDSAVTLFTHAIAVGAGLGVLIFLFQPISGSHFNPAVSFALWRTGSMSARELGPYVIAQIGGAVLGVAAAHLSFGEAFVAISSTDRTGWGLLVAELMATFVLVLLILVLVRTGRSGAVAVSVGAWVAVIVYATSSTGFANPAVTLARIFTDTFTGIAPGSVVGFLFAQMVGALGAVLVASALVDGP